MRLANKKFDYKWVILILCFLMEFICLGFCSSNAGLYLTAVTKALGFERSLFSVRNSIRHIVSSCVSLYFGVLINKLGIKKMVCIGLVSLLLSTTINAYAETLLGFYLGGAFLGLGVLFTGGTMAGTIIRNWFHENVGRYTGIAMAANGIGGALAAQIISPLIHEPGNPFGYRNAYKVAALITLAVSILIILFLKPTPSSSQPVTYSKHKKVRGAAWSGVAFETIKKRPYFYVAAFMILLTGVSIQSIGTITLAHMTDIGIDPSFVTTAATVSSLILTVTKILVGITYDKKGLRFALFLCHAAALISFVLKALLVNTPLGKAAAIIAVICGSLASPLDTVMIPLITYDLFGDAGYAKVLGVFMSMKSIGLCIGSPIGDLFYDTVGTYVPVFWIFSVTMLVVIIAFQIVAIKAEKEKIRILSMEMNSKKELLP